MPMCIGQPKAGCEGVFLYLNTLDKESLLMLLRPYQKSASPVPRTQTKVKDHQASQSGQAEVGNMVRLL